MVGKYTNLLDSYKSLAEALAHGGIANRVRVALDWVDSQIFEKPDAVARLEGVHGILVPGGFGERGTEGKIEAVRFARERRVPFFGICFGMQMAVIECARHLAGLPRAPPPPNSAHCEDPVVGLLTEWARGNEIERRAARRRSRRHHAAGRLSGDPGARLAGQRDLAARRRSPSATATATR